MQIVTCDSSNSNTQNHNIERMEHEGHRGRGPSPGDTHARRQTRLSPWHQRSPPGDRCRPRKDAEEETGTQKRSRAAMQRASTRWCVPRASLISANVGRLAPVIYLRSNRFNAALQLLTNAPGTDSGPSHGTSSSIAWPFLALLYYPLLL